MGARTHIVGEQTVNKAIVLLSGGQDSTTCLYWPRARWSELHAVSIRYGQRHAVELDAARKVGELAGVASHLVLDLPALGQLADSALTGAGDVDSEGPHTDRGVRLPATFVPGRNVLMLTLAAARAVQVGAHDVVCGVCETDFSGYPDCRGDFLHALAPALELAMPESARPLRLHAPLLALTKADEVRLARELPGCWDALAHTVTCYRGERPGCGACPACRLRARGFAEAGYTDPAA